MRRLAGSLSLLTVGVLAGGCVAPRPAPVPRPVARPVPVRAPVKSLVTDRPQFRVQFPPELSPAEVSALEARIAAGGGDCDDRGALAAHYLEVEIVNRDDPRERVPHLLWLAEHCPRHDQSSLLVVSLRGHASEVLAVWDAVVERHPTDPAVLANAAALRLGSDDDRALALYARAEAAAPNDPQWPLEQAWIYQMRARLGRLTREEDAAAAYAKLQRAAALSDDAGRFDLLAQLAAAAFEAGDHATARAHAREALDRIDAMPRTWNTGNLIHDAHVVLGRIALAEENRAAARAHLIEAGKTPGSPTLDSFGPDVRLAAELLALGDRGAVTYYFELCARFWKDSAKLELWRRQLRFGATPDLR